MKVERNHLSECLDKRLLCVTHSDRPMHEPSCDINYLEKRYASSLRIPPLQPFETLTPSSAHTRYLGGITVYDIGEHGTHQPGLVCAFRPETYKPQHCIWHNNRLWVVAVDHIQVYDAALNPVTSIRDPWLAGNHTIAPDGGGGMLVSCSGTDSVLRFSEATGDLESAVRMPEDLHGFNYPLGRSDSVVDHYIGNDLQLAHINCAWPWRGGVVTSNLIHGSIGWFHPCGNYHELLRGFVGCHGARVRSDLDELYFSDSCAGMLVFLEPRGVVTRRVGTGSRWLHDAIQISGDLFALAPFERNEVILMDVGAREVTARIPCDGRGGPQFLAFGGPAAPAGVAPGPREVVVDNRAEWRRNPAQEQATRELRLEIEQSRRELERVSQGLEARCREIEQIVKSCDAFLPELREERAQAAAWRNTILTDLRDERTQAVIERDRLIAELDTIRARDVGLRDAMLAEQAREGAEVVAARDATIARLTADLERLGRDVAFITRGWRRWITGRRPDGRPDGRPQPRLDPRPDGS
jgi:hypothetical protein